MMFVLWTNEVFDYVKNEGIMSANSYGGVAQLGEHLPCKQGVMGSNPIISTMIYGISQKRALEVRILRDSNRGGSE